MFDLLDSKPLVMPEASDKHLYLHDGDPMDEPTKYMSLEGDISHVMNQVCKFMQYPTELH